MITRRQFLATAGMATMAMYASGSSFLAKGRLNKFGFITGIIGKELEGDWRAVLKQAASYGFTEIETSKYLGDSASSFLKYCSEIGITPIAGGVGFTTKMEELLPKLDSLLDLKLKYAVSYWPWLTGGPFKLDDCKKSAEMLNIMGEACKKKGLTLCWHNHDKEFTEMEEGMPFDYLMNHTDPSLVKCEMDIYWVKKGGADPLQVLKKYKGRIPILHVKDMAPGPEQDFECPGSGIIDFPAIFKEADSQDIKHYFVERDKIVDGLACLKSSGNYLKNLRF